jgi:hypothetical protein
MAASACHEGIHCAGCVLIYDASADVNNFYKPYQITRVVSPDIFNDDWLYVVSLESKPVYVDGYLLHAYFNCPARTHIKGIQ